MERNTTTQEPQITSTPSSPDIQPVPTHEQLIDLGYQFRYIDAFSTTYLGEDGEHEVFAYLSDYPEVVAPILDAPGRIAEYFNLPQGLILSVSCDPESGEGGSDEADESIEGESRDIGIFIPTDDPSAYETLRRMDDKWIIPERFGVTIHIE